MGEGASLWQRLKGVLAPRSATPTEAPRPKGRAVPSPGPEAEDGLATFAFRLPKVELQVQLEGSARPASLLILAKEYGVDLPGSEEADLRRAWRYEDRAGVAEARRSVDRCLRREDDFRLLVRDLMAEQAMQSIVYSEAVVDVGMHLARGFDGATLRTALDEAIAEGEAHHGIRLRLLVDLRLGHGTEIAREALEWARSGAHDPSNPETSGRVVGVVLNRVFDDGRNGLGPLGAWTEQARSAGLGVVLRVGQPPTGCDLPLEALLGALNPDRLADVGPWLVSSSSASAASEVLGSCPTSIWPTFDLAVGLVESWKEHPIVDLLAGPTPILLGSGAPQLCQTHLSRELVNLHRAFGLDKDALVELLCTSARHAFLPSHQKEELEAKIRAQI